MNGLIQRFIRAASAARLGNRCSLIIVAIVPAIPGFGDEPDGVHSLQNPAVALAAPNPVGEQQPEVEHAFAGEGTESGEIQGHRWRHGRQFQYLDLHGATAADPAATYSGGDRNRNFDVFANDTLLAIERLKGEKPGEFFERRYPLPGKVVSSAANGRVTVRFCVHPASLAGGVFDVRLMRPTATGE